MPGLLRAHTRLLLSREEAMGQVAVTVNGRTYRLKCGDGEEARLLELAAHLTARVDAVAKEFGQVGDDRLLLMAALLITDELFDLKERVGTAAAGDAPSAGERRPSRRGKAAVARPGSESPEPRQEPGSVPGDRPA